jgi:uncharacterized protein involved in type VI secretion and phage assembly
MDLSKFYENLVRGGLEYYEKYYNLYTAYVTSVADPEKRGRVQIECPEAGHNGPLDAWVNGAFDLAGPNRGTFFPPQVGDVVRVAFAYGNVGRPLFYIGGFYSKGELPAELGYGEGDGASPYRRGIVTQTGHLLTFNDEKGKEEVVLQWNRPKTYPADSKASASRTDSDKSYVKLLPNGSVEVKNKNGSRVTIDAAAKSVVIEDKDNSNTLTFDSSGVKVQTKGKVVLDGATALEVNATSVKLGSNASKSAVLGEDLIQWLNTHTHGTAVGPSSPPVAPATATMLSTTVKVK